MRGTVAAGRDGEFVEICRRQVAGYGRASGLNAFIAGYRRVDGHDNFVLVSTWDSQSDAVRVAGDESNPTAANVLAGNATVEGVDVYDVIEPVFTGIVDAPGGVVRLSHARVAASDHARMLAFLRSPPRDRSVHMQRLMLGWAIGQRRVDGTDAFDIVAVTAWPSALVIEAVAESNRLSDPIYPDVDLFATDFRTEQFRAIGLELPDEMADIGSRRVIAARFDAAERAALAAQALRSAVAAPDAANISVAPLGAPGTASDVGSFILVARVAINEYSRAERLIGDHGGDVILSQIERVLSADAAAADEQAARADFAPGLLPTD